jgi:hypothetical protein
MIAMLLIAGVRAMDTQSKKEDSLDLARQLWEKAVEAKGGRDRLSGVENIAIIENFGNKGPSVEVCVFPDRYWFWEDRRPGKLGLGAGMKNFEQNAGYFVVGHLPYETGGSKLSQEERSCFRNPQLLYFLETRWFKPQLVRGYRSKLGSKDVDVVEVKVDEFRIGVYLDPKTHLPIRISYFLYDTGERVFDWYGLSDYREVKGIMMPHSISYNGGRSVPLQIEVNFDYDPAVFERAPSIDEGPFQWRPKGSRDAPQTPAWPKLEEPVSPQRLREAVSNLQSQDENVYIEAREVLFRAGKTAIPLLTESLKGKRGEARYRIASALLEIDNENEAAIKAFRESVIDSTEDGLRRRNSAFQLAVCEKGIAILMEMLRDKDVFVRRSAVFAFDELTEQSEIPDIAKKAIPSLKELLKDLDEIVRGMAKEVLEQMGVIK